MADRLARAVVACLDGPCRVAAFVGSDGTPVAVATSAPLLVDLPRATAHALIERHPPAGWAAAELFLNNDPFAGGVRLDLVAALAPVLVAGRPVGLALAASRVPDVGAMAETAFAYRREVRHEGFRLRLVRAGAADFPPTLAAMLSANVRQPEAVLMVLRRIAELARSLAVAASVDWSSEAPVRGAEGLLAGLPAAVQGVATVKDPAGSVAIECRLERAGNAVRIALASRGVGPARALPMAAIRSAVLTALGDAIGCPPVDLSGYVSVTLDRGRSPDGALPERRDGQRAAGPWMLCGGPDRARRCRFSGRSAATARRFHRMKIHPSRALTRGPKA
ncbi:MAG: hydantoinase B/oxoprolinase family protein [Pseudomonadota bacterium]